MQLEFIGAARLILRQRLKSVSLRLKDMGGKPIVRLLPAELQCLASQMSPVLFAWPNVRPTPLDDAATDSIFDVFRHDARRSFRIFGIIISAV